MWDVGRFEAVKADLGTTRRCRLIRSRGARVYQRYVQVLFKEHGTTFTDFAVKSFDSAPAMLRSPRYPSWTNAGIALEAGFHDVSDFNRRFKRRVGLARAEVWQQLREGRSGSGEPA